MLREKRKKKKNKKEEREREREREREIPVIVKLFIHTLYFRMFVIDIAEKTNNQLTNS